MYKYGWQIAMIIVIIISIASIYRLQVAKEDLEIALRATEDILHVVEGEYTLIYDNISYTYINQYYFEGDRVFYTREGNKQGNCPAVSVRIEQGFIPYHELPKYGLFVYED